MYNRPPEGAMLHRLSGTDSMCCGPWVRNSSVLTVTCGRRLFCLGGCMLARIVYSHSSFLRSEEHTSELQSRLHLVCRLLLEKKKKNMQTTRIDYIPLC